MAIVFNADSSQGSTRLLFAANPELEPLSLPLGRWAGLWVQLADHDRFWGFDKDALRNDLSGELQLPPLGSGLWMRLGE